MSTRYKAAIELYNTVDADVVTFDNAGHWVHHDRLQAFVDTVGEFIE